MKFAEYLENAARLERKAAEVEQPHLKALLLKQAEVYKRLRNERGGWESGSENRTDATPVPIAETD
jgi:hypothetical protein